MEFIGFMLAFVGFVGFIVFLIILIVMAALKHQKAPYAITMGCFFACCVLGLFLLGRTSSDSNNSQSNSDTTTLQGEWKQTNSNSKDSYQAAIIQGNSIEIYWVNESSGTISLYWARTFEPPEGKTNKYTWESENDKSRTNLALLASSDETKVFNYENGVISYSASAFGSTMTIKLKMNTWGYDNYQTKWQSSSSTSNTNGRMENMGDIGDYYIEIHPEFTISENRYGETVIIVSFDWTNNSSETTHASLELNEKAFQDGIELDRSYDSSLLENDNDSKDIRPGAKITVQKSFVLGNTESPVEFEVYEFLVLNDTGTVYRNFDLKE